MRHLVTRINPANIDIGDPPALERPTATPHQAAGWLAQLRDVTVIPNSLLDTLLAKLWLHHAGGTPSLRDLGLNLLQLIFRHYSGVSFHF